MTLKTHWTLRFFTFSFFVFVALNLAFLNYMVLKNARNQETINVASTFSDKENYCDTQNCVEKIYDTIKEATSSLKLSEPKTQQVVASNTKENFIPFGSGSSNASDWTDVGGVSAYVDTSLYPNSKSVTFEVTMSTPTGNQTAYARLFNKTDKHPVWFSDVSIEGGGGQLVISKPITLDSGNKQYQVQMKTSLQYQTNLLQARLHIVTY